MDSISTERKSGKQDKRRRISCACNFCRLKKMKCDGRKPKCSMCHLFNQSCDYPVRRKRRGFPAGHYQVLLRHRKLTEYILGFLTSNLRGAESTIKLALTLLEFNENTGNEIEDFQNSWKQSLNYSIFERLVPGPIDQNLPHMLGNVDEKIDGLPQKSDAIAPFACIKDETGGVFRGDQWLELGSAGVDHHTEIACDSADERAILKKAQCLPTGSFSMASLNYIGHPNIELLYQSHGLSKLALPLDECHYPQHATTYDDDLLDASNSFTTNHCFDMIQNLGTTIAKSNDKKATLLESSERNISSESDFDELQMEQILESAHSEIFDPVSDVICQSLELQKIAKIDGSAHGVREVMESLFFAEALDLDAANSSFLEAFA